MTQVEEVKILIRMLPIIASTIIMNTCLAQLQTFSVIQGNYMEPHLGTWKIATPSITVIPLIFMVFLLPLYEFFFIPFARDITGHPNGVTQLQRVGIGLFLSIIPSLLVFSGFRSSMECLGLQICLQWLDWWSFSIKKLHQG